MAEDAYVPERGDLIWLDFTPHSGHEQAGRRPAIVLSPRSYNQRSGLALFCPITSRVKGYPWEVGVPAHARVTGVILADQVRSLDWRSRNATFIDKAEDSLVLDVVALLGLLIAS